MVHDREPFTQRTWNEVIHNVYRIEPMNVRIHHLAQKVWQRLEDHDDPNLRRIQRKEAELEPSMEHTWWPRSRTRAMGDAPAPLYRGQEVPQR